MVSMSSLFGEICQLFCCPPRPSHIVAKLAFLPPPPTYSIISSANDSTCCIEFKPEAGWQISEDIKSKLTVSDYHILPFIVLDDLSFFQIVPDDMVFIVLA